MTQVCPRPDILIVDDQRDFAEGVAEVLAINGYNTRVATTPETALRSLEETPCAIALVDLRLDQTSGLSLIEDLKKISPNILCLIMTAYADVDTAVAAVRQGAYDYLKKPMSAADLLANLERCCERIQLETQRQKAIEALAERELAYSNLFNNMLDVFFRIDMDGNILNVSPSFQRVLGYGSVQALQMNFGRDIIADDDARRQFFDAIETRDVVELFETRASGMNGDDVWLSINMRRCHDAKGQLIGVEGLARDISERIHAQDELVRLATAIDQAAELIFITDTAGNFQYVNPSFERVTGYCREEVIGKNVNILKSGKHGESFYRQMWQVISGGRVWRGKLVNKRKDGTLFYEEASITPIRDTGGKVVSFVAVKRDVTKMTMLEGQLRQAQKMEAIGTLAGGIAHDFNNILSSIMGYTELAVLDSPEGASWVQHLNKVLRASHRAKELVNQILTFSRHEEHELVPVDIKTILYDTLKLLRASLPTTIEIRRHIAAEKRTILADPTQIHQVIMNICTNARHAMREQGGVLEVRLEEASGNTEFSIDFPSLRPEDYLMLSIRDSGHGMPAAMIERIFDPYFTTKEKGEGTGLGLAIVHSVVQNHGGHIRVQSEPGKGTCFFIFFPHAATGVRAKAAGRDCTRMPGGAERVLVVDDEEDIIMIVRGLLTRLGYQVEAFHSSNAALERFREAPYAFDVVITDMTMPLMTGDRLAANIKESRPDVPVLLCTGFSEKVDRETFGQLGVDGLLMKPIAMVELATTLRQVLDAARITAREKSVSTGKGRSGTA